MQNRNVNLDILRIMATFAVIWSHVSGNIIAEDTSANSVNWWICNAADSFSRWCVPVFIMISGALLLSKPIHEDIKAFYVKRGLRVLIPLLFWVCFYTLWNHLCNGEALTFSQILKSIVFGSTYYHLWYLFMIVGLYIAFPFLSIFISHIKERDLIAVMVASFLLAALNDILSRIFDYDVPTFFLVQWIPYIGYAFSGYYFYNKLVLQKAGGKHNLSGLLFISCSIFITILTGLLFPFLSKKSWGIMYSNLNPLVIISSLTIFTMTLRIKSDSISVRLKNEIVKVSNFTFGIYLIHPLFLGFLRHIGISANTSSPLIFVPLTTILAFLLSLLASLVLGKIPILKKVI